MVFDPKDIQRRLAKLSRYLNDLRELLPENYHGYVNERRSKYAVERLLLLITESVLDILDHALSARFDLISDSYEEILRHAEEYELLSTDLHQQLSGMGGFRNVLAHEYLALRDEEVYRNAHKILAVSDELERELRSLLEE